MKFGVTTYVWSAACDACVEEVLPAVKEHGFDGIEVPLFRPKEFPAARIRKACETNGLEMNVSTVMVDGMSLISEEGAVRRKTIQHLKEVIATAADVNARIMAGPVYSPVGFLPGRRRTQEEWKWAVEGYRALADTLAANHVTLAIEPLNRFETYFLNTAADAVLLASEVSHSNVGILFDTFHANIEEKDVAAAIMAVAPHLKYFHTSENDRGTPGSGHVDWESVFSALHAVGYDGWLTIESFGFSLGDLSAAAAIWRDIEKTPASIAFDGIQFLRQSAAATNGAAKATVSVA